MDNWARPQPASSRHESARRTRTPNLYGTFPLRAQAVASRKYTLFQVEHRRDRPHDMVDDEDSQVYGGMGGESAAGRRAVDETRSQILVYAGKPIYAMFTANAGWYTGDPGFIFDQPLPYLNAVPDPYSPEEQASPSTRSIRAGRASRS